MKQHITKEDLEELSSEQRNILSKWAGEYNKRIGSYSPVDSILDTNEPELNIGQMIKFLYDNRSNKTYKSIQWPSTIFQDYENEFRPEELCDALFEAVKEELK